ncbi:hypothetical protein Val02_87460 [Virgisporangium aliadipatigenens]|uniref:Pyrrolo-quinoline quinone repeat domain-containing protein n=1 Tax=Virgisporangium aliadipatigenens TaxID=741659 RepID=A0A8J3YY59_9ACTN|nr:PQQ-binding-like beta-propeller repeat protein [Virgisporangium aliadipatigenens]GIJ51860.1 hypothetical protein Val02_87460 [Virgisporangium aliadipatigenens]
MTATLIDLDRPEPPEEPRPLPRWASRRVLRRALLLLPLLLVLPLAASGPPVPPRYGPPIVVPLEVSADFVVTPGGIFFTDPGGAAVRAVAFDGRTRWRTTVPASYRILGVTPELVLLTTQTPPSRYLVLDAATGAVRWRHEGRVASIGERVAVFSSDESDFDSTNYSGHLVARRWSDGAELWRFEGDPRQVFSVLGWDRPSGLILADGDSAEFVEPETGTRVPLANWPGSGVSRTVEMAFLLHGILVAVETRGRAASAYGYDPRTGSPLWTVAIDWNNNAYVGLCGPHVCLPDEGGSTLAVDPRTGEVVVRYPFGLVGSGPPGRLLAEVASRTGRTGTILLDAATAQVIRSLDGWAWLGPRNADVVPIFRTVLMETQVALMSTADGRLFSLGPHRAESPCDATGMHLVCRARGGGLLIWRYATALPPPTR